MLHLCDIGTSKNDAKRLTCKCAWRHSGVPFYDDFATAALQKMTRARHVFHILTWKCASRYSRVPFFDSWTPKSGPELRCFAHFDVQMCFAPHRRAIFRHQNFQKWAKTVSFLAFWLASRHSGVPFFLSALISYLRTRRFSEPTLRPSRPTNHCKNTAIRDLPNIRAGGSSFFWLSRNCIFFLLTLLLFSAFHLLTLLLCSAFSTLHIVGS